MKIELITADQHATLQSIYESTPALFLQNKGFEGINKDALRECDKEKLNEVNTILKSSITGFRCFQNFRLTKSKDIQIRFQYNYGAEDNTTPFTGVGYILLDELLNGFESVKG